MKQLLVLFVLLAGALLRGESKPLVIAHRGASGYLPEHTLAAKALAFGMAADALEQDVVLSKDGVPVVLHDVYLDAVTDVAELFPGRARADGKYYALDFTLHELKQLHLGERVNRKTGSLFFPGRYAGGQSEFRIVTLEEELRFIQGMTQATGRNVIIYPELKSPKWHRENGADLTATVLLILERFGYGAKDARCYVQCFEWEELKRVRAEFGWKGKLVMLIGGQPFGEDGADHNFFSTREGMKELAMVVNGIGPNFSRLFTWDKKGNLHLSDFALWAHANGLVVHPYTVRRDQLPPGCPSVDVLHAALFDAAKVDGVFTDFPDLTLQWLNREQSSTQPRAEPNP